MCFFVVSVNLKCLSFEKCLVLLTWSLIDETSSNVSAASVSWATIFSLSRCLASISSTRRISRSAIATSRANIPRRWLWMTIAARRLSINFSRSCQPLKACWRTKTAFLLFKKERRSTNLLQHDCNKTADWFRMEIRDDSKGSYTCNRRKTFLFPTWKIKKERKSESWSGCQTMKHAIPFTGSLTFDSIFLRYC